MNIKLPFKEDFKERMLSGRKTCTSRNKIYGKAGDTFEAFGATFEITDVERHSLRTVAWRFYYDEGFSSPEEFTVCWKKIHPRKGFIASQLVWVHWFRILDD